MVLKKRKPIRPPNKTPYILPGNPQVVANAADVFSQFEPFAMSQAKAALIGIEGNTKMLKIMSKALISSKLNSKRPAIVGIIKMM